MVDTIMRAMREGPDEQPAPELDQQQLLAGTCLAALLGLLLVLAAVA